MASFLNMSFSANMYTVEDQQTPNVSGNGVLINTIRYCTFAVLSFISLVENFRVISIFLTMPQRKRKKGNILIAHLSLMAMLATFMEGDYILLKFSGLGFIQASYLSCIIRYFIRDTLFSIISLNVAAINYEQTEAYKKYDSCGGFLVWRCISLIWIIALVANLPGVLTIQYSSSSEQCEETFMFGSAYLTFFYEFLKYVLFNAIPVGYITHTLFKYRSIVSEYPLRSTINMTSSDEQTRFAFFHGLAFLILWLPFGILPLIYKFHTIQNIDKSYLPDSDSSSLIYMLLNFMILVYLSINPLINLHLNRHLSGTKWYGFTYQKKIKVEIEIEEKVGECSVEQETNLDSPAGQIPTIHESQPAESSLPSWNLPFKEVLI